MGPNLVCARPQATWRTGVTVLENLRFRSADAESVAKAPGAVAIEQIRHLLSSERRLRLTPRFREHNCAPCGKEFYGCF